MSLTTITRSKPFYVAAGATDLAVKTLRQAPSRIPSVKVKVERRDLEKAVANVGLQAVTLPARAQATAVGIADEVTGRADAVYGDLLVRGRKVVGRIRRQKATQDLKKDATTTVRRSKATATTAKKSAAATGTHRQEGHQAHLHDGQEAGHHHPHRRQGRHHVGPQDHQVGSEGHHGRRRQGRQLTPAAPRHTTARPPPGGGPSCVATTSLWRVDIVGSVQSGVLLLLGIGSLILTGFAFFDVLRRKGPLFPHVGKLSKNVWLGILGAAFLISIVSFGVQLDAGLPQRRSA